jgi:pyruvate,water dikinase
MVASSGALTAAFDDGVDDLLARLADTAEAADFLSALDDVRRTHGARGPIEWDSASPSWETRPELILSLVDRLRFAGDDLSPANRRARVAADRAAAEAEVRAHLAGDDEALATLDHALHLAGLYVPARERTKLTEMMAVHEVRVVTDELGRRMTERGVIATPEQVNMLTNAELDAFIADPVSFADTIRQRCERFAELGTRQEPFIIYREQPDPDGWPLRTSDSEPVTAGEVLQGVPGGPGKVVARARVVHDAADPRGLEPGDILVAAITDPAWTPLFISAAGVVVEIGAPMSHAMIVSRELGVPCVTGIQHASTRIADGMLLEVDGGSGTVTIVELA